MTAAIDSLPGALQDPGRQPAAGTQAELKRLIDQVRPPVVQDGTRLIELAAQVLGTECRQTELSIKSGRPIAWAAS